MVVEGECCGSYDARCSSGSYRSSNPRKKPKENKENIMNNGQQCDDDERYDEEGDGSRLNTSIKPVKKEKTEPKGRR